MDTVTIPNEILSLIFELACNESGKTAKALILVSQRFNAVVQPFLLTTITVEGQLQIQNMQARLDSTPEHLRRVRHAFVSDWTREQVHEDNTEPEMFVDDYEKHDAEAAALARLLDTLAPTLNTLTFLANNSMVSTTLCSRIFATAFPHLEELTLKGFYPFPCADTMPRLRHLHLSGNRNPHGLLQLGALPTAFPNLTHLRFSGLSGAASFAQELKDALLDIGEGTEAADHFEWSTDLLPSRVPASLSLVEVQPGRADIAQLQRTGHNARSKADEQMMRTLRELQRNTAGETRCRCVLVPAPNESEDKYETVRAQWNSQLLG